MIETGITLLRLLLGLGAIFCLGYALLTLLVPRPRDFSCLERAAFSFGVGVLVLTLWMLALTWRGVPFGLAWILGPPLALAAALLLTPRGRRAVREDRRALRVRPRIALSGWDWLFLGLLGLVFLYALPRAALYPMWAWDAVATWGCKARIFYNTKGLDLTCIDAHNYYPNLIPLLLSYLYFALGQVNDYLVNAIFPLWGALLLGLLYSLATRLGLSRRWALGLTAFLALNGTVFIVHLYIAYADLPLAFFTLGGAALLYLWLADAAPRGSLTLAACFLAGMAWCKYEGPPLAATLILAAALTLVWLRPAALGPPPGTVWPSPWPGWSSATSPGGSSSCSKNWKSAPTTSRAFIPTRWCRPSTTSSPGWWNPFTSGSSGRPWSWPSSWPASACGAPPGSSWPSLSAATSWPSSWPTPWPPPPRRSSPPTSGPPWTGCSST